MRMGMHSLATYLQLHVVWVYFPVDKRCSASREKRAVGQVNQKHGSREAVVIR